MKKDFFIISIIFLCLVFFNFKIIASDTTEKDLKKGVISVGKSQYYYSISEINIIISDNSNNIVFFNECKDRKERILDFGYSKTFNSFYVFKSKFKNNPLIYQFLFETENSQIIIEKESSYPIYSPILIEEKQNVYIAYINEDRTIIFIDLLKNKKKIELKSKKSIYDLQLIIDNNENNIIFKELNRVKYKSVKIPLNDIFKKKFNFENKKYRPFLNEKPKTKILSKNELQYNKFICFGDSITFGKINKEDAQELGYVPRLLSLLQTELYSDTVIVNEGISGSKTLGGLERIEEVVTYYMGKFILIHYGANDMIDRNIPINTVIENIDKMVDIAIHYGVTPVLSTLIPGNKNYGREEILFRTKKISEGIREIAKNKNILIIDLYDLFVNYPDTDGGYFSLMSDNIHPSEKGYQLMAEEWLDILLSLPPNDILEVQINPYSGLKVSIQWANSIELDVNKYKINYGFSEQSLNREVYSELPSYTFIFTPSSQFFLKKIYFKLYPVDKKENSSLNSPLYIIDISKNNTETISSEKNHINYIIK